MFSPSTTLIQSNQSVFQMVTSLPGEENFEFFSQLPLQLYTANQLQHKQTENVSKEHLYSCYTLFKDNKPVGRFALYLNPDLTYNQQRAACLGSYECINEEKASRFLLEYAKQEAKKAGAAFLIGPMEGSTWNNYRFSNHNQHPNFLLEPYHHIYYNQQFLESNFSIIAEYESTLASKFAINEGKVNEIEKSLQSKGLTFRNFDLTKVESELLKIADFSNEAFKENFLYTPIHPIVFAEKYKRVVPLINPTYVWLAEESNGNLAGVHFCYDSQYVHEKALVVKTLARNKNKEYVGLGNYLAAKLINKAFNDGYEKMIYAFMQKDNTAVMKLSDELKAIPHKTYSLYGISLHN